MKKHTGDQRGTAAMEAALAMLILMPLLLIVMEGSNALLQYSQLQSAAKEGARMTMRQQGDTAGVKDFVQNLLKSDNSAFNANVPDVSVAVNQVDATSKTVEVKVDHAYTPLFSSQDGLSSMLDGHPLVLSVDYSMALP